MNKLSFFKWILSISLCLTLYSCSNTVKNTLPVPEIKDGIAKLSGTITNFHLVGREDNPTLILRVPHPVTAEAYVARTTVDEDGAFSVEVPMQCNYAVGYFRPEKMYNGFYVCLTAGKEAKMDIMCEKTGLFRITNQTDSLGLTAIDLINMEMVSDELMNYRPPKKTTASTKMPDEFAQRRKIILNYQLKILAESDSLLGAPSLSEIAKDFVVNNTKVLTLDWYYFDYRRSVRDENFNPPIPDKQYYTFLKDFDLNNPQYLYRGYFNVLQRILSDETLNIPLIGDRPVEQWMKEVRKILSKLVGFNKGLFYDMLAANSYARQFNNELRPLSDKQQENIKNYFKDDKEDFAKILLRKNEEIILLAAQKDPLMVNETPAVPKEELPEAIISKYRGKVVVLDFWATWCAPCLLAMEEYRKVKGKLQGRELVFVYITNATSPQKLWEEKIKGIGGEHYYIDKEEEWVFLMDTFRFEGIPSYVIFDTEGKARHKFTGYPGNEQMQTMIENLLPFSD